MDVLLIGLLAKRVAIINVGELLQHLADLLGECGIGVWVTALWRGTDPGRCRNGAWLCATRINRHAQLREITS